MKPYKAQAHINSLNGELREITVLEKAGDNDYIVDFGGVKCHALFNWFVCCFYADDVTCNKNKGYGFFYFFGKFQIFVGLFDVFCSVYCAMRMSCRLSCATSFNSPVLKACVSVCGIKRPAINSDSFRNKFIIWALQYIIHRYLLVLL